jgi:hypothetical protein
MDVRNVGILPQQYRSEDGSSMSLRNVSYHNNTRIHNPKDLGFFTCVWDPPILVMYQELYHQKKSGRNPNTSI